LTVELRARPPVAVANAAPGVKINRQAARRPDCLRGAAGVSTPGDHLKAGDMTGETKATGLTYAAAGVDIDAGNALVERIKPAAAATARPGVMSGLGGFGALFDPRAAGYADPVLVAATD